MAGNVAERRAVTYRYSAITTQDRLVEGTIKARSEAMAEQLLFERGYRVFNVAVAPPALSLERLLPGFFATRPRDIISFSRQLATLLEAGISLTSALEMVGSREMVGRSLNRVIGTILNDLRIGLSFSQALAKHPQVFDIIYCRTIAVGERTGVLGNALRQLSDYMEKHHQATKKLKGALAYPTIMLVVGVAVVIILLTFVLPPLIGMFATMGVALPLPTRILIALSGFITKYKLLLFGALAVLALAFFSLRKQPRGRQLLDRLLLKTPIIGPSLHMGEVARFSRTMSILLGAGVSLQEIMEMIPQTTSNSLFRDGLSRVREGLILGEGLSGPMSANSIFPKLLLQMVTVGEESNTLGYNMEVVANFYELAAEEKLSAMLGMIQPLSIVVLAGIVGFIALSVVMPIYSITGAIG